jgi:hypothetical protein
MKLIKVTLKILHWNSLIKIPDDISTGSPVERDLSKKYGFFSLDAIKGNSHQYFGDYATTGDILDEDVMIIVDIILDSENDYSKLFFK